METRAQISSELHRKRSTLDDRLGRLGRLLVAYSGGVDSAFLAHAAHQVLGKNMKALIADSPSLARTQLADALAFVAEHGIPCDIIHTQEMENRAYVRNDAGRCFHCKDELFTLMENYRCQHGFTAIAYGVNADDQKDFRPGQKAAAQHGIAAPLLEAGLTKAEIRELARSEGLALWDKPASPCLASRIEYGRPVTIENLSAVEQGEEILRSLGFSLFRVRHHGQIARIEIAKEELPRALDPEIGSELIRAFKALGFTYVTLDLEGFRSGSMNQMLSLEKLAPGR